VKAVQIPKSHGDGVRVLGVPTIADRVAQTVVARRLGAKVEPIFHPDSYGNRPDRSALDAVAACRQRCWKYDWTIDLDVQKFFDSVEHDLMIKAVEANTDLQYRARSRAYRGGTTAGSYQVRVAGTRRVGQRGMAWAADRLVAILTTRSWSSEAT
jgi:retron-type reverse transcriptase